MADEAKIGTIWQADDLARQLPVDKFQEFGEVQHSAVDMLDLNPERDLRPMVKAFGEGMLGRIVEVAHSQLCRVREI